MVGSGSLLLSLRPASSRFPAAIQTALPSGASRRFDPPDLLEQSRGRTLNQVQLLECTEPVWSFVLSQGQQSATADGPVLIDSTQDDQ